MLNPLENYSPFQNLANKEKEMHRLSFSHKIILSLLALGFVLYVYRFNIFGVNFTLLRIVSIGLILRGLLTLATRIFDGFQMRWPTIVLLGSTFFIFVINVIDYHRLASQPELQKIISAHLFNILMLFSIVGFIDNEQKFFFSLKAYVLMSIVGLFIAYYAYFFDKIPFIFLIRSYGFDAARSLHYINVNSNYVRLAGSFYDPNFYGIYLFSVIIFSGWLYKYSRGSKFYLILIGISIVTLLLTVSRTALIGLGIAYMFFIALDAEHKRAHLKGMGMLLAIVVIDYAAGLPMLLKFQPKPPLAIVVNHATNSSMSRQFQSKPKPDKAIVADHPASLPIPFQFQSRPHETIVPPYVASPPIRWFNTRSVMLRLPFYKVGWKAFKSNVLFGGGLIALFNPTSGTATAHMAYLSLLGKYGLFGTMIYLIFIFYPVGYIYFHRQNMHARYRNLVVYIFAPLAMMYFSYDFLSFLEFEYFLFAIGYVIVIYNFSIRPHPQMALTHIDHIEKTYEYGINSPKRPAKMADTPAVSGKNGILQSYLLLAIGYTLIMYGFSLIHVHG